MSLIRFMPPRGTSSQCSTYVGTLGELFVDTTAWQLRMSDGTTAGGHVQGGISNLIGCSDVLISSPSNGDVLTYNTTAGKWENVAASGAVTWSSITGKPTTVSGYGITDALTTAANTVANASLAQMATLTIKGNNTAGTANAADLTASQVKGLLAIASTDVSGLATSATTDTTNASNIASGTLGAARLPAFTGDVTSPAGSSVNTIAAAAVTLAKMANLAANSIMGNNTGSAAAPLALSASQVKTLLAIGAADVSGVAALTGATFTGAVNVSTGATSGFTITNSSGSPWAINLTRSDIANTISAANNGGVWQFSAGLQTAGSYQRTALGQGWLDGNYTVSGGETSTSSGPIYSIGGPSYRPGTTTLGTMYGIGYCYSNATLLAGLTSVPASNWGLYAAAGGTAYHFLNCVTGNAHHNGACIVQDAYNTLYTTGATAGGAGGKVSAQSGGTASGGNAGDIIIIY